MSFHDPYVPELTMGGQTLLDASLVESGQPDVRF